MRISGRMSVGYEVSGAGDSRTGNIHKWGLTVSAEGLHVFGL